MGIIGTVLWFLFKAVLWVLAAVLAVLFIVLITPVKLGFTYPDILVYVKWNGIKYTLYPMKRRKKKKQKEKTAQKREPKQNKKAESTQNNTQNDTQAGDKSVPKPPNKLLDFLKNLTFEKIKAIIRIVLSLGRRVLKGITFEQLYMVLTLADEDKAKLAQTYGQVCMFLTEIQPMLESVFTVKDQHINVGMDFSAQSTVIAADIIVYVRPGTLLMAALSALIKIKKEGII